MNLQNAIMQEQANANERLGRAARRQQAIDSMRQRKRGETLEYLEKEEARARELGSNGNVAHIPITPARWFDTRFPGISELYGDAVSVSEDKDGRVYVDGLNEDFLAATMGETGTPEAPTVYLPHEQRFFTYDPGEGIYRHHRDAVLIAANSSLLLACARACVDSGADTKALEYKLRDAKRLIGVIQKARGHLEVEQDFFNTDLTEYIACANGMLRLSDNTLLPFAPSYHRRNKLAIAFDPNAQCPRFINFLHEGLEDDDIETLQRWTGLALTGENLAQKILILIGTAGGGKGTFIRILRGVIGPANLGTLRPQLLTERFEQSRFLGKTLLYGPDVPENFLNQRGASALKSLTGYDPMTVELKNSNESPSIIGSFNVIVTCNSRLTVHLEGDTDAWRRRLVILDYHKDKPKEVIADLDQQLLRDEGSGILNWMLAGLHKLRADGWQLHLTVAQQRSVDNLLLESDSATIFVREALVKSEDGQLTVNECFAAYGEFCNDRGWTTISRNKFGQIIGDTVMRQHGKAVRNDVPDPVSAKAQRGWRGLKLRSNERSSLSDTLVFDDPERQRVWDQWENK